MNIVTFFTNDPLVDPKQRAVARILLAPNNWHPVIFPAANEVAARIGLQNWWDGQLLAAKIKQASQDAAIEKASATRAKTKATKMKIAA